MRLRTALLISIIALCFVLAGCGKYDYSKGKEIPVTVAEEGKDVNGFKSEFEKLQELVEEGDNATNETEEAVEVVADVVEEETNETAKTEEVKEEPKEEVVVEEVNETTEVGEVNETEEVAEEEEEVAANTTTEVKANETVKTEEVKATTDNVTIPTGATVIKVKEGDLVNLAVKSEDADADTIKYTFTEPLSTDGEWQTKEGDAGTYKVTVTATDGELSTSQDVYVVVNKLKKAPVISGFDDLTVKEGETVTLSPKVSDPDGDKVTLEYSGWMTSNTKELGYSDAGDYKVTLTATDATGESTAKTIAITVENVNRAPKIVAITNG